MSTTVPGIPVSPVTRERIGGLLDAQEWPYDTDEEGDFCLRFNGDLHTIATFGEREEVVNVVSWMPEDIPMELLDESGQRSRTGGASTCFRRCSGGRTTMQA